MRPAVGIRQVVTVRIFGGCIAELLNKILAVLAI